VCARPQEFPLAPIVGLSASGRAFVLSPLVLVGSGQALATEPTAEDFVLFARGFDGLCSAEALQDQEFLRPLSELSAHALLSRGRFLRDEPAPDQDYDAEMMDDFAQDEQVEMLMGVMRTALVQSLQRICKRPDVLTVKRMAHTTKGAAAQLGARAIFRAAAELEQRCASDPAVPLPLFQKFFLLVAGFIEDHPALPTSSPSG
jgi:HPt (histidine-containing phosphotransfer) domain-containing protein